MLAADSVNCLVAAVSVLVSGTAESTPRARSTKLVGAASELTLFSPTADDLVGLAAADGLADEFAVQSSTRTVMSDVRLG